MPRVPCQIRRASALVLLASAFGTSLAGAADFAYQTTLGGGSSDNVTRVSNDPVSESIASAGLRASLDQDSRRIKADVVGDFAYYDYLGGTYDSEVVGSLVADSSFALIEDRLLFTLRDNYGQVLDNPFIPATPENRDNVNYLDTGLQGTLGLGAQSRLLLGGSYALASYEHSPLDSESFVGEVAVLRLPSDATSYGLRVRSSKIEYTENLQSAFNYDQSEAFLQYSIKGSRTMLDAAAGYTELDRDIGGSESGPLFRLQLDRRISSMSRLSFGAGQEYSNSASAFATGQSGTVGLGTASGRQTAAPFTNRYLNLAWRLAGHRTELELSGAMQREIYPNLHTFDETLSTYRARVSRSLSSTILIAVSAEYERAEFELAGTDYADVAGNLFLNWQMSRRLSLLFTYQYSSRNSGALGGGYAENRFWLSLAYQRGAPRDAIRGPLPDDGG